MLSLTSLPRFDNGAIPAPSILVDSQGNALEYSRGTLIEVTPVLDTAIYADGDVLFDTVALPDIVPANGGIGILDSIAITDEDDQGVALDLVFLRANVSLGAFNVAPAITDINAREVVAIAKVLAADYSDLGGARVATVGNLRRWMKAVPASRQLFVAGITRGGTPTYTASGLKLKIGVEW